MKDLQQQHVRRHHWILVIPAWLRLKICMRLHRNKNCVPPIENAIVYLFALYNYASLAKRIQTQIYCSKAAQLHRRNR